MSPIPASRPDPQPPAPPHPDAPAPGWSRSFMTGMAHSLPMLLIIIPFALLFGVVATEAGLDLPKVMGFSVLVLAGASQFTAVQLISDNTPAVLIILSALAVNLRMAMYSASMVPWLGKTSMGNRALIAYLLIDQTYAMSVQHYETHPRLTLPQRLAYFFGSAVALCLPWMIATWLGATVGQAIPDDYALDFALPITFLAMIAPMLRTTAHIIAAGTAILFSLLLAGMPSGSGLLIAGPLGMVAGAWAETRAERKAGRE